MSIAKLKEECSSKIRKSQVITKVSDVVRELVDNAVDANAHSVQILLDNYGLKKIEVKDNGDGMPSEDIPKLFKGGFTSKLNDDLHLSCNDKYGFRGEALSAICSFSGITVTSKRHEDAAARKYVLNKLGDVTAENVVPCGNGTVIIIRDLFKDFPVRNKHCSEPKTARAQLKEIEFYLKCLGICNPSVYFALYHNGNLIWSKPAVRDTEQALTTVLGVSVAKNLSKCLSAEVFPDDTESSWKGELNLFVPQKPVDMKTMGFTNSKMTMIFVNRRPVVVEEYQHVIKRYAVGSADNPTQQEQRKFPLAVFMVSVPPTEVDFNRDMDKSKIFMQGSDQVLSSLEGMLQSYYGVNLSALPHLDVTSDTEESSTIVDSELDLSATDLEGSKTCEKPADKIPEKSSMQIVSQLVSTPEKRKDNISAFLGTLTSGLSNSNRPTVFSDQETAVSKTKDQAFPLADFTISLSESQEDHVMESCNSRMNRNTRMCIENNQREASTDNPSFVNASTLIRSFLEPSNILERPELPNTAASTDSIRITSLPKTPSSLPEGFKVLKPDDTSPTIPQCGAFLHNEPVPAHRDRISLPRTSPISHHGKRPRHDSPNEVLSPEAVTPSKRFRQVTLEDLRSRDAPKPLRNVSTGSPQTLSRSSNGCTSGKIRESNVSTLQISATTNNLDLESSSLLDDLNSSSVLGIESCVSIHDASWSQKSQTTPLEGKSSHVISSLGSSGMYIVKIDGLLGVFNPAELTKIMPALRTSSQDHQMDVNELLDKFATAIEFIDAESAQATFYILADLEAQD